MINADWGRTLRLEADKGQGKQLSRYQMSLKGVTESHETFQMGVIAVNRVGLGNMASLQEVATASAVGTGRSSSFQDSTWASHKDGMSTGVLAAGPTTVRRSRVQDRRVRRCDQAAEVGKIQDDGWGCKRCLAPSPRCPL